MKSIFTGIAKMMGSQSSDSSQGTESGGTQQATGSASEEYALDPRTAMVVFTGTVATGGEEAVVSPPPPVIVEEEPEVEEISSSKAPTARTLNLSGSQASAPKGRTQGTAVASRLRKRKRSVTSTAPELKRSRADKGKGVASQAADTGSQVAAPAFDIKRFSSVSAQKRYEILKSSKFINEKEVTFGDEDGIKDVIQGAGMIDTVQQLQEFDKVVLREFWANLPSVKVDTSSVDVLVRDWVYEFSPARINELFGLPQVDERTHRMQMAGVLEDELAEFMTGGKVKSWKGIQYSQFTEERKMLYKICCSNWLPTTNDAYPHVARAKLIFLMANQTPFNFGKLVYEHILQLALNPQSKFFLPFPSLVTKLLMAQHPVQTDKEQPATKKKKNIKASAVSGSKIKVSTASERRGVKLAIQILQQALAAGGDDDSDSDSGNNDGGVGGI